jgi:hypothetical protein
MAMAVKGVPLRESRVVRDQVGLPLPGVWRKMEVGVEVSRVVEELTT